MHSSDTEPLCLYQQFWSVVALLLVKCIHPACVWKYVGGSDRQLAHLAQNSLKFLQAGEDKDCHFFQPWKEKKKHIKLQRKERPKWRKPENVTVPCAVFIACHVRGGRGD